MGTRVAIIGAVGAMCIEATRDLIETSGYDEFMLADKNVDKCNQLKKEYADSNIIVRGIDATNYDDVVEAISGYDFVMNGLPFGIAETTTKACMDAGIPNTNMDDFPKDYYYDGYEKANVLCASGIGATPGTTDMLAKWGVAQCDSVEQINVSWASFRPIAISPGLVLTTFWEMAPDEKNRAYYEDGKLHPQPPLKESKTVKFEEPFGELEVYYVPHPETTRLAEFVPGIKKVVTMGTWPPIEMELLKQLIDFGIFDKEEISHCGETLQTLHVVGDLLHQLPRGTSTALWGYALHVETIGVKDGRPVKITMTTSHPHFTEWGCERAFAKNVAIPMSIGAQLMLAGKTNCMSGYHVGYDTFEPEEFFAELRKRGILVHEKMETRDIGKSVV